MQIQDVMMHLLLKQPFYGYAAASISPVESREAAKISMVTMPSLKIIYNREWFESLSDQHAVGVVIHELLHLILLHPVRRDGRERSLWVIACDMAVNEHIDESLLPKDYITVEKIGKEIKEVLPRSKSAEFYYGILSENEEKLSFVGSDKEIKIMLKSGLELKANNSVEDDSSEVNKSAFISTVSELVQQARAEGEVPGSVSGYIEEEYKAHEINWRNVLKRFLTGRGRVSTGKTYKKESKRYENMPGNKRTTGTAVLLALDESGSISGKQIGKFYNELLQIKNITGVTISVTQFDTGCTRPVPVEMYLKNKERAKNGGTDFRPIFELADKMKIHLVIIFTDGDGIVPEHVNQKVLWFLTKGGKRPAQFGNYIEFG